LTLIISNTVINSLVFWLSIHCLFLKNGNNFEIWNSKAYTDGFSVPKEIIQNADDASATKVCFMYDERENDSYGKKLLDKNMIKS
jgi:hypothetical protein